MTNLVTKTMPNPKTVTTLDALGQLCPWPLILTKQALKSVLCGDELCILSDDPLAELDIRALCERDGHTLVSIEHNGEGGFAVRILKTRPE